MPPGARRRAALCPLREPLRQRGGGGRLRRVRPRVGRQGAARRMRGRGIIGLGLDREEGDGEAPQALQGALRARGHSPGKYEREEEFKFGSFYISGKSKECMVLWI